MILKLLHFRDKEVILQAAHMAGKLKVDGNRVMLFPDYTLAVQHQHATYLIVKKRLRELGLKYSLFPGPTKGDTGWQGSFLRHPD